MAEYHVGVGLAGIYAGTLKANGMEWRNKSLVTNEVLCCAAEYLEMNQKEFRFTLHGERFALRVVPIEARKNEDSN